MTDFSQSELERYNRHLSIPEIGIRGQRVLKEARVLVIGAGGLGSPVIQYLAAAGVGVIGIADFDLVESSNLQRQVIFSIDDIGQPKSEIAAQFARKLNEHITVRTHNLKLDADNISGVLSDYDVAIDGSDNFATRYIANDACVKLSKPNIQGAVHRFEGQVTVYVPGRGACYRCIFPNEPEPGTIQNCAEAGVLGVLPGIVGSIMASECLKLILGIGELLEGKLYLLDALSLNFQKIKVDRNANCTACGDAKVLEHDSLIQSSLDVYSDLATPAASAPTASTMKASAPTASAPTATTPPASAPTAVTAPEPGTVFPQELLAELNSAENSIVLVDVREKEEYEHSHLQNALHIPIRELEVRANELLPNSNLVLYCKSGARSRQAARLLRDMGYLRVRNLTGGLLAWVNKVDNLMSIRR